MAVRSLDSAIRHASRADGPARLAGPPIRHSLRPRLTAIAPSTVEVVRCAGGWLFDQVLAGWDVTVLTADHGDSRALEILGARVRDLETMLGLPLLGGCLQAIAVWTDLYESDERVRAMVLRALDQGQAELRFFGDFGQEDLAAGAVRLSHRLSFAARAFKAQAVAAARAAAGGQGGAPAGAAADRAQDVEMFRTQVRRPSPAAAQT